MSPHSQIEERLYSGKSVAGTKSPSRFDVYHYAYTLTISVMDDLPVEILQTILGYLDDPRDLSAASQCSRNLYRAAAEDLLWKSHLHSHWNYSVEQLPLLYNAPVPPQSPSRDKHAREQFRRRKLVDLRIQKCVLSIVEKPHGRLKYVDAISDHFMDAADAVRSLRLKHGRRRKNYGIDYYCCLVERHLSRKLGIHVLQKKAATTAVLPHGCDYLYALFGIGCFHRSDGLDLHLPSVLIELKEMVEIEHGDAWLALPVYDEGTRVDKISILMKVMSDHGIRPASELAYYDLQNSFLYSALKDHRPTIPITMVAIFVALATLLGLDCHPIGFPGQVLAAIKVDKLTVFVAPYEAGQCYDRATLINRLHLYNLPDEQSYLASCTIPELCVRSARNILNCIERGTDVHTLDGLYAALVTLKLMGQPLPLAEDQFMTLICLHYPYDIEMWSRLQEPEHHDLIVQARLDDVTVRKPKRRAEQPVEIRHRVGTIFRHALFNYTAIITGWDHYCDQSPEWIRQMRVNLLERKTQQPFYNVLVSDGSERYVAEDNVLPITDNEIPVFTSLERLEIIGKYFKSSIGNKFVFSSDLTHAYPDDVDNSADHIKNT